MADFNNDGTDDMIYPLSPVGKGNVLCFVDGRKVNKSEGRYYRHYVPASQFGNRISVPLYREYKPSAEYVNADLTLDFVMRPDPKLDQETKQKLGKWKIVYVGDGKGNFSRSDEYSF